MTKWVLSASLLLLAMPALAFPPSQAPEKKCTDCHQLTLPEANALLKDGIDRVVAIEDSEVPGYWMVLAEKGGQKFPLFLDYTKSYLVAGNVIRLKDKVNLTAQLQARFHKVDRSRIPLDDALLLGSKSASKKVIVFTDPQCPYCKKLHAELQEVVKRDPEIAFLIKLFPLKMHPQAYGISKTIVCLQSLELLEKSFAGEEIPQAPCDTPVVDQTLELVKQLGINSTPTLVLPDGQVVSGFKDADELLRLLGSGAAPAGS